MITNLVSGKLPLQTTMTLLPSVILPPVSVILATSVLLPLLILSCTALAPMTLRLVLLRVSSPFMSALVLMCLERMCLVLRRKHDYLTREPQVTCSGNARKPLWSPVYGDDGQFMLECTGYKDTDQEIASYREQTDMAYIISRINAGDTSVMPDPDALFADVTELPNTPIGMVNFLDGLRRQFDSLPAETREKFDNSFSRFVAGVPVPQPDEPVAEPVDPPKPEEVLDN